MLTSKPRTTPLPGSPVSLLDETPPPRRVVLDENIWGKRASLGRPYPLIAHLLDTAASTLVLWDDWLRPGLREVITAAVAPGDPDRARRRVALAAGLHDLGKASAIFQAQPANDTGEFIAFRQYLQAGNYPPPPSSLTGALDPLTRRHEACSHLALNGATYLPTSADPTVSWAPAVTGAHHGRFHPTPNALVASHLRRANTGAWADQQHGLAAALATALELTSVDLPALEAAGPAVVLVLSGLTVLADWLASEDVAVTHGQSLRSTTSPSMRPGDWLAARTPWFTARLPQTLGRHEALRDPVQDILGEHAATPSPLQQVAARHDGGLFLAAHPTGDGKTEAALLRHAATGTRLIFALPTRSTATAMMRRIERAYAGTTSVGALAHGTALLDPFYAPAPATIHTDAASTGLHPQDWFNSSKRQLLAPVAVATCDQVLAGALRQVWSPLRLLALANAHVVLDEVHTYDQYQSRLLTELLAWWGATGTPVTLLSATLPTWQRNQFVRAYAPATTDLPEAEAAFPSHTLVTPEHTGAATPTPARARRTYTLRLDTATSPDAVTHHVAWAQAQRALHPHARLGVIVNTVGRAQQIANALREGGDRVLVLHSRMTAGHREDAAATLMDQVGAGRSGAGITVVGTQVVEASLDIDLDAISTDLAPASSLIQRAGRMWRHHDPARVTRAPGAGPDPVLHVHATITAAGELDEYGALPYPLVEQSRTWAALHTTPVLAVPGGVQRFVDASAFTWADLAGAADAPGAQRWADGALDRVTRASAVSLPLTGADGYLADPRYEHLVQMTQRDEVHEAATRYIDVTTGTYLLCDLSGTTPHAWTGQFDELATTTRPAALRRALAATVPANGRLDRVLRTASERTFPQWDPRSRHLRHLRPVDLTRCPELTYDPLLGLTLTDTTNLTEQRGGTR